MALTHKTWTCESIYVRPFSAWHKKQRLYITRQFPMMDIFCAWQTAANGSTSRLNLLAVRQDEDSSLGRSPRPKLQICLIHLPKHLMRKKYKLNRTSLRHTLTRAFDGPKVWEFSLIFLHFSYVRIRKSFKMNCESVQFISLSLSLSLSLSRI